MADDRGSGWWAGMSGALPREPHLSELFSSGAGATDLSDPPFFRARGTAPEGGGRPADRGSSGAEEEAAAGLRRLLDAIEAVVIATDEHGTIEFFNSAAERLFGYSQAEIGGKPLGLLLAGPDRRDGNDRHGLVADWPGAAAAAAGGATGRELPENGPRQVTARRRDASTFPAELSVSEVRWDDRRRFVGTVVVAGEHRAIEERLWVIGETVQDAFDSFDGGIALWDRDGGLVFANQAFRDLHSEIADALRPAARLADLTRLQIERGALATDLSGEQWLAARLRAWGGRGLPYDEHRSNGRVVRIEDCVTRGGNVVSTCRDVTALLRAEQRPRAAGGAVPAGRPWSWARSTRFIVAASALLWAVLAMLLLLAV